jgi:hypothetical protein
MQGVRALTGCVHLMHISSFILLLEVKYSKLQQLKDFRKTFRTNVISEVRLLILLYLYCAMQRIHTL